MTCAFSVWKILKYQGLFLVLEGWHFPAVVVLQVMRGTVTKFSMKRRKDNHMICSIICFNYLGQLSTWLGTNNEKKKSSIDSSHYPTAEADNWPVGSEDMSLTHRLWKWDGFKKLLAEIERNEILSNTPMCIYTVDNDLCP